MAESDAMTPGDAPGEVRFPYRPGIVAVTLASLFFAACAGILALKASTNQRGLVLARVIEFSVDGATNFYWALAGLSVLFVAAGLATLVVGLRLRRHVVIGSAAVSFPANVFSRRIVSVSYTDIESVTVHSVQRQRFLNIRHRGGKSTIPANMLRGKGAFDKLLELLQQRVP